MTIAEKKRVVGYTLELSRDELVYLGALCGAVCCHPKNMGKMNKLYNAICHKADTMTDDLEIQLYINEIRKRGMDLGV